MTNEHLNLLGKEILDSCITVHREMGPGLLESVYVHALMLELGLRGITVKTKVALPLFYKGIATGKFFEIDLLVENEIIVEAKAVETMHPVYSEQVISYLKLAEKKVGYLVNFNEVLLKNGFKRYFNNF